MEPIKIFIGYDHAESVAWHVLAHSILMRSSAPVSLIPINIGNIDKSVFNRPRDQKQSNEFAFTRWLVPYLCNYRGCAIFMDCDMLLRTDITELVKLYDEQYAVQVVKHDYVPKDDIKYLGNKQTSYNKKNWSSVMMFNCAACKMLTPEYINTASGLELHQFKWLSSDDMIGALPATWNWLVGEYDYNPHVGIVHFTVGGPYFKEYAHCDYSAEWRREYAGMTNCAQLHS